MSITMKIKDGKVEITGGSVKLSGQVTETLLRDTVLEMLEKHVLEYDPDTRQALLTPEFGNALKAFLDRPQKH